MVSGVFALVAGHFALVVATLPLSLVKNKIERTNCTLGNCFRILQIP